MLWLICSGDMSRINDETLFAGPGNVLLNFTGSAVNITAHGDNWLSFRQGFRVVPTSAKLVIKCVKIVLSNIIYYTYFYFFYFFFKSQ